MKICFICHKIGSTGGTEKVVSNISKEFKKLGYECYALSMGKKEKLFFDFSALSKIEFLDENEGGNRLKLMHSRVKKIRRFIKDNKIEYLITVGAHLNYYGFRAKGKSRWIAWEHEMFGFNKSMYVKFSRFLGIKKAYKIVVLTEHDRKCYVKKWKKCTGSVTVIGNFTDSYYVKDDTVSNTVLSAGRLWNIKQYDLLIEAWALISKKVGEWKLVILGEGTERKKLEGLIEKYSITNVYLPGNKQNIEDYYKKADIFTVTSTAEGFPMVILEAMAFSIPIAGFMSEGGVDELVDERNGILTKQGDIYGLADALLKLINDRDLRCRMGKASYQKSLKYSNEKIVEKWKDVLEDKN